MRCATSDRDDPSHPCATLYPRLNYDNEPLLSQKHGVPSRVLIAGANQFAYAGRRPPHCTIEVAALSQLLQTEYPVAPPTLAAGPERPRVWQTALLAGTFGLAVPPHTHPPGRTMVA
jgi:hypothetical protein